MAHEISVTVGVCQLIGYSSSTRRLRIGSANVDRSGFVADCATQSRIQDGDELWQRRRRLATAFRRTA